MRSADGDDTHAAIVGACGGCVCGRIWHTGVERGTDFRDVRSNDVLQNCVSFITAAVKEFRSDEVMKVDQQAVTAEAALADERLHLCERK